MLAGVVLGLAFNTKLLEALVAAPALAVFAWLYCDWGALGQRALRLAVAALAFVVVSLSWITIVSLVPLRDRPYPLGSTNGSPWNVVFVYNGTDRLFQPARPDTFGTPSSVLLAATSSAHVSTLAVARPVHVRHARAPASPVGPLRLFAHSTLDYGGLLGVLLLSGIVWGGLSLLVARPPLRRSADARAGPGGEGEADAGRAARRARRRRARGRLHRRRRRGGGAVAVAVHRLSAVQLLLAPASRATWRPSRRPSPPPWAAAWPHSASARAGRGC